MPKKSPKIIALKSIELQQQALKELALNINESFTDACELILKCTGKIAVIGMGKSGHIGKKIAATLASTGTPAFFIHPAEACHGDMGMISKNDVIIAISYSGETAELTHTLGPIKKIGAPIIALTASASSTVGKSSTVCLLTKVELEACPLNLAPTCSTTATLVLGDALAVALLEMREFSPSDFARRHPGGSLGRRLLLTVQDVMHKEESIPSVSDDATLEKALVEASSKRLGMTTVLDGNQTLCGIFTDGDLRRAIQSGAEIYSTPITSVMTTHPYTISKEMLATEALELMRQKKITTLPITEGEKLVGVLHLHDLLQAGISSDKEA